METVTLPKEKLTAIRERVLTSLAEGTREAQQEVYRQIVATISHPAAVFRGRCVKGTGMLQYSLNAIIILRIAIYGLCTALGIFLSWWWLVGIPLWLVCDLGFLNRLQAWVNLELVVRLVTLDELMDEDEDFRKRVLAILAKMTGQE